MGCDGTAGGACIVLGVLTVQFLERALDALVDLREEVLELVRSAVARFGVDRFARAAVNGDEVPRAEVQRRAQPRALTADRPHRLQGVLPAGRHRLVSRPQLLAQPHSLHMPVGLLFHAPTRTETVERAIHGALQPSRWVLGRSSRGCGCGSRKAERGEVEVVDKGGEKTDGLLFSNIVVEPLWEQALCVAVCAVDKTHERTTLRESKAVSCGSEQC
jgi:hypothetical protein